MDGKYSSIRPSFGQQLIALLKRNFLIKRRNLSQTFIELIIPLVMTLFAVVLNSNIKYEVMDAINEPIGSGSNWFITENKTVFPDFTTTTWFISPQNTFTTNITREIKQILTIIRYPFSSLMPINNSFKSSEDIEKFYFNNKDKVKFAIIFEEKIDSKISYTIRMPFHEVPNDQDLKGNTANCRENPFEKKSYDMMKKCPEMKYYRSGFSFIQTVIDSAIIKTISANISEPVIPLAKLSIYPKPRIGINIKLSLVLVSLSSLYGYSSLVSILISNFVLEKEKKIKEAMLMMGLRVSAYWLGWIITETIVVVIISLLNSILVSVFIFKNTNILIIFLLVFLFGLTMIGVSAIFTPFFDKEKTASGFSSTFLPIAILSTLITILFDFSAITSYFLSLISPIAVILGFKSILQQTIENNSSLTDLFTDSGFSFGSALMMLFFDCFLYTIIAIYLDQVIPGEYGSKQNCFFCFDSSFWAPNKPTIFKYRENDSKNSPDIEEVSAEFKAVINISEITKKFKNQKNFAVNKISLSIYESQITALLGHNGAGKTTLINMLVGSISPTDGTAYIYGHDISNPSEMNDLRSMFGVCLQQDILLDDLNAEEHLVFFGWMKGIKNGNLISEVNKLLIEVELYENRRTFSKNLSGGEKRKLCIAIALIGSPKILILDEPTSGVDAYTRKQIWALIQTYKKNITIILTTHFMDEADVLSDRKAIISNGMLRCAGSSLFLKRRFGVGYHLTIDVKEEANIDEITSLVRSNVKDSKLERFTGFEVYYILPQTESQNFSKLFQSLDIHISGNEKSDVKSYGISMTTLEEVFLRIGTEDELQDQKPSPDEENVISIESNQMNLSFEPTFIKSFKAFFYLRFLLMVRNPLATFGLFFSTFFVIGILYIFSLFLSINRNPLPLLLNSRIYEKEMKDSVLKYQNKASDGITDFVSSVTQLGTKVESIDTITFDTLKNSFSAVIISNFKRDDISWEWLFNDTYIHSLPILQNLLTNTYLQFMNIKDNNYRNVKQIEIYNHPFPYIIEEIDTLTLIKKTTFLIYCTIYLILIPITTSLHLSIQVIDDREIKVKDILRNCGLTFCGYWFTTFVYHSMIMLINISILLLLAIFLLKVEFIQSTEEIICVWILCLLLIPALLLSCYVLTHLFDTKINASNVMPLICIFPAINMGVICLIIVFQIGPKIGLILHIIFCLISPFYVTMIGFVIIAFIHFENENSGEYSPTQLQNGLIICFICLIIQIITFSLLLLIADILKSGGNVLEEFGLISSNQRDIYRNPSPLEDEDVKQERIAVQNTLKIQNKQNKPILLLHNLRKEYWKSNFFTFFGLSNETPVEVAVNNLSLMVEKNKIFGLLGPNGAGKTSTIKIIIRDEKQTQGKVIIDGQEVKSSNSKIYQSIGYCPQHDTLWKEITLREHLYLFAAIRGIPSKDVKSICLKYMNDLKIIEHSDKKTEQLSGGTKRKLCYIISLLGPPKLVLLDEPSTGMDPKAKRFVWKTIQTMFNKNSDKSAVLTTHSMEEANALCTRLAIMTKGIMRCIGSVQHLKNKYGAGYMLEIKWNQNINCQNLKQLVSTIFIKASVREEYENRIIYHIPQESVQSLSLIFTSLENAKSSMTGIQEYSFSQTTFEQVFIHFAKEKEEIIK